MKNRHWLVKQEPESYSWETFALDGRTRWEGVRNYQARNNLKAMAVGDPVLFHASGGPKSVIGVASVSQAATPDQTAEEAGWVAVELRAVRALARPVTLAQIKTDPSLGGVALLRNSRLSVIPLTRGEFERIVQLGG
jgi:predicted RNA-binding protein with PUA-like domain